MFANYNINIVLLGKCRREWLSSHLLNRKSLEFSRIVTNSQFTCQQKKVVGHVFVILQSKRRRFHALLNMYVNMHNILLEISISKISNRYSLLAYQSSRYSSFCLIETSLFTITSKLKTFYFYHAKKHIYARRLSFQAIHAIVPLGTVSVS